MLLLSRNAFPKHERRRNASTWQSIFSLRYSCGRVGDDRVPESNHDFKDQSESSQISEQGRRARGHGHRQLRSAWHRRLRTRRWHGPDLGNDHTWRAVEGGSCWCVGPGLFGSTIWWQELRHRHERRASTHQNVLTKNWSWVFGLGSLDKDLKSEMKDQRSNEQIDRVSRSGVRSTSSRLSRIDW